MDLSEARVQGFGLRGMVLFAAGGAVVFEVLVLAFSGSEHVDTGRVLGSLLAGVLVGALVDLLREVLTELQKQRAFLRAEIEQADRLAQRLKYQDESFGMLLACPRHGQALSSFLLVEQLKQGDSAPFKQIKPLDA